MALRLQASWLTASVFQLERSSMLTLRRLLCTCIVWTTVLHAGAEIRDCESEFYDITGDSGSKIVSQMRSRSRVKGGFFAATKYGYKSRCGDLTLECRVRLPRWTGFAQSQNIELKKKWAEFYPALVAHEQGHVDIFQEAMEDARESAKAMQCGDAKRLYQAALKKVKQRQKAYDSETDHGMKTGALLYGSNFQSLAYSRTTQAVGYAFSHETQAAAEREALKNCKAADCKVEQWARGDNACITLASNAQGAFGTAWASGQEDAEEKALRACEKHGTACAVRITVCPTGKMSVAEE